MGQGRLAAAGSDGEACAGRAAGRAAGTGGGTLCRRKAPGSTRQTTLNTVSHAPFPLGRGPTGISGSRKGRVTGWTRSLPCPPVSKAVSSGAPTGTQACGRRAPTALFRASHLGGCKSFLCLSSSGFNSNLPATLFDRKEEVDSSVDRHPDCVGNSACVCVCFP